MVKVEYQMFPYSDGRYSDPHSIAISELVKLNPPAQYILSTIQKRQPVLFLLTNGVSTSLDHNLITLTILYEI